MLLFLVLMLAFVVFTVLVTLRYIRSAGRCEACRHLDARPRRHCPCCGEEKRPYRARLVIHFLFVWVPGMLLIGFLGSVVSNAHLEKVNPALKAAPIRSQIVAVNDNRANISVGSNDGVRVGLTFIVFNDTRYLADLIITDVEPDSSAGELKFVTHPISPGDRVVDEISSRSGS